MDGQNKAGKGKSGASANQKAPTATAHPVPSMPGGTAKGYKIESIEGIGPKNAEALRKAGISRSHHLLARAATRKGRKELAATTGLDEARILKWTNMCDLMRIRGVGEEFSELLEAAGVDTIKELAQRRADNLHKALEEANAKRKMVRQLPTVNQCENWVAQAKTLSPIMAY